MVSRRGERCCSKRGLEEWVRLVRPQSMCKKREERRNGVDAALDVPRISNSEKSVLTARNPRLSHHKKPQIRSPPQSLCASLSMHVVRNAGARSARTSRWVGSFHFIFSFTSMSSMIHADTNDEQTESIFGTIRKEIVEARARLLVEGQDAEFVSL